MEQQLQNSHYFQKKLWVKPPELDERHEFTDYKPSGNPGDCKCRRSHIKGHYSQTDVNHREAEALKVAGEKQRVPPRAMLPANAQKTADNVFNALKGRKIVQTEKIFSGNGGKRMTFSDKTKRWFFLLTNMIKEVLQVDGPWCQVGSGNSSPKNSSITLNTQVNGAKATGGTVPNCPAAFCLQHAVPAQRRFLQPRSEPAPTSQGPCGWREEEKAMLTWLLREPGGRLVMWRPAAGTQDRTAGPASQPSCATWAGAFPRGFRG